LRAQAAQNEEGYVPISILATFNKMKQLTTDLPTVVNSLKKSPKLSVNSDGSMVKRIEPLPELDITHDRSIYSKGWPEGITVDDVTTVFSKYGKVLCVRIRKTLEKKQKDSAFVEFSSIDEAKAAMDAPEVLFKGQSITRKMKNEYYNLKKEERKQKQKEKKEKRKEPELISSEKQEGNEAPHKKQKTDKAEENQEEEKKDSFTKGLILKFNDIGPSITREILKEIFGEFGSVVYCDFNQNDTDGFIRFATTEDATSAVNKMKEAKKPIGGKVPQLALLEGEEEEQYWQKVSSLKGARQQMKHSSRGRGGRGRGGRGGRGRGGRGGRGGKKRF